MELPLNLLGNAIERGVILHSTIFEDIDHGKFFLVMGVTEDSIVGFFFINSNINPILEKKQALLDMQYGLKKEDYAFLRHDSFVNAARLLKISHKQLAVSMQKGHTTYVDKLKPNHLQALSQAAYNSPLFTPQEKRDFFK